MKRRPRVRVDVRAERSRPRLPLISYGERDLLAAHGIREEAGYSGAFTRAQAPGALPNGTRIVKIALERADTNVIGATGAILGSIAGRDGGEPVYFVEWDHLPRFAVSVLSRFIAPLESVHG